MPKVSVIIPVYNVEKYLSQCLNSVCGQTLKDIEIICVNDGSTDKSGEILALYAAQDKRIKVVSQHNKGQSAARNRAVKNANGDYIFFIDSDDCIHPQTLEILFSVAEKTGCSVVATEETKKCIGHDLYELKNLEYAVHNNPLEHLLTTNIASSSVVWNKLYAREVVEKRPFIEGIYFEDWPWTTCLFADIESYASVPYVLYQYNTENQSTMRSVFSKRKIDDYVTGINNVQAYFAEPKYVVYWPLVCAQRISASVKMMINKTYHETAEQPQLDIYLLEQLKKLHKKGSFQCGNLSAKVLLRIFKIAFRRLRQIYCILRKKKRIAKVRQNYDKVITSLRKQRKLKVLFLVNEVAKWKTQSLFDLMAKSELFEPVIALTLADYQLSLDKTVQQNILEEGRRFFSVRNMECVIAYDIEQKKAISLETFRPHLVFYQQPWGLEKVQTPRKASKYALTCYVPYYVPDFGIQKLEFLPFHTYLWRNYVFNDYWLRMYTDKSADYMDNTRAVGHTALDFFYLNRKKKTDDRQYVIYAPHWSIKHPNNINDTNLSTFEWSGLAILKYAQKNPQINWVFKPHPLLRHTLYQIGEWSPSQIDEYFRSWEKIATCCFDGDYYDLFMQSQAMITDSGSFLMEYFCTGKPLIHLVPKNFEHIIPETTQEILDTYYEVRDLSCLEDVLNRVLVLGEDIFKDKRYELLQNQGWTNSYAAQNIINDIEQNIVRKEGK